MSLATRSGTLGVLGTVGGRIQDVAVRTDTTLWAITLQRVDILEGRLVLVKDLVVGGITNFLHGRLLLVGAAKEVLLVHTCLINRSSK